jgi:hypothetical protein
LSYSPPSVVKKIVIPVNDLNVPANTYVAVKSFNEDVVALVVKWKTTAISWSGTLSNFKGRLNVRDVDNGSVYTYDSSGIYYAGAVHALDCIPYWYHNPLIDVGVYASGTNVNVKWSGVIELLVICLSVKHD